MHILRLLIFIFYISVMMCGFASSTWAQSYDVVDLAVSIQSADAVKARDQAIVKAQRIAFAQLIGQTEEAITKVDNREISRLVRDFSVRGERLAARSYQAYFTIRFDPVRTQNYIDRNGYMLTDPTAGAVWQGEQKGFDPLPPAAQSDVAMIPKIVVLPVLDIGSRRVVWDEPNPWRDVWQKQDHSIPQLKILMPQGDIDDVTDIPDAGFISQKSSANIEHFLERYGAEKLYILVAKNQGAALDPSGGMALSLYKHDGKQVTFVYKQIIRSRPGYLFDDALNPGLNMILKEQGLIAEPQQPTTTTIPSAEVLGSDLSVTVPYQSLGQWVDIQKRLRRVPGIKSIVPIRLSPSSAQVRLVVTVATQDLNRNLNLQNFDLQIMPSGEMVLTER